MKIAHLQALLLVLLAARCSAQIPPQAEGLGQGKSEEEVTERERWDKERRDVEYGFDAPQRRWEAFRAIRAVSAGDTLIQWQALGPHSTSGRIISYAFHPDSSDVLWVGSATGGLWKSTDGGLSWRQVLDLMPTLAISAVGINPANPEGMLLGTGQVKGGDDVVHGAGVFRTADGGRSWQRVEEDSRFDNLASLLSDATGTVWMRDGLLLLSNKYGIWWGVEVTPGQVRWFGSFNAPTASDPVGGKATALVRSREAPDTLFAAFTTDDTGEGRVMRSTDGGAAWRLLDVGLPGGQFGAVELAVGAGGVVYAGVARPGRPPEGGRMQALLKSTDWGDTWQRLRPTAADDAGPLYQPGDTLDLYCMDPVGQKTCQGNFGNVLAASPTDSNLVFAGSVDLYRSADGGHTWSIVSRAPRANGALSNDAPGGMHVDFHGVAFHPTDARIVYAFTDGGVYRSGSAGVRGSWEPRSEGLTTLQAYAVASDPRDPARIVAGAQDQGTQLLEEGSWRKIDGGDGMGAFIAYREDGTRVIHGRRQKGFLWRLDEGEPPLCTTERCCSNQRRRRAACSAGIAQGEFGLWRAPLALVDAETLYTATRTAVFRTTDGGLNWLPVLPVDSISVLAVAASGQVYAYAKGDSLLHRSLDGGATWDTTATSPGGFVSDLEVDPDAPDTLYATRANYRAGEQVWRSVDRGDSWQAVSEGFPSVPAFSIAVAPAAEADSGARRLFAGTELGVFMGCVAPDGSVRWSPANGNLPLVVVNDLHYYPPDGTLRIATHGRGIWKAETRTLSCTIQ